MNFLLQRAIYYALATNELEHNEIGKVWNAVAECFGITSEELRVGEELLSKSTLMHLKTVDDVRLMQKCGEGFGNVFKLTPEDEEVIELKYQALLKLKQLDGGCRGTLLKAVASSYRRDAVAAVLYVLQIFLHNKGRSALGYEILAETLSTGQNGDAGLLLLNMKHGDKYDVFTRLAETPEMILHPEVLIELADKYGVKGEFTHRRTKIGF